MLIDLIVVLNRFSSDVNAYYIDFYSKNRFQLGFIGFQIYVHSIITISIRFYNSMLIECLLDVELGFT